MRGRFKKLIWWYWVGFGFALDIQPAPLWEHVVFCLWDHIEVNVRFKRSFLFPRWSASLATYSSAPASVLSLFFALSVRYLTKPNGFFSVLLRENQFAFFLLCFFLSRSPLPRSTAHQFSPLPCSLPPPLSAFAGSAFILTSPSSSLEGIKVIAQMITQTSVAMETWSCDRDRHASSTTKEPISKPAMES